MMSISNKIENARNYALNNLVWEIIAGKYLEMFEEVLSKQRGGKNDYISYEKTFSAKM